MTEYLRTTPQQHPTRRTWRALTGLCVLAASLTACGANSGATSSSARQTALLNAGLKAQQDHQLAAAVADYLQVLKLDRSNRAAWYDLGVVAQDQGYPTNAEHDYRQAVAADPHYVPALYNLATVVAATSPSAAVGLYQEVIALAPRNAAAHFNLGLAEESVGNITGGQAQIAQAIKLQPSLASRVPSATGAQG